MGFSPKCSSEYEAYNRRRVQTHFAWSHHKCGSSVITSLRIKISIHLHMMNKWNQSSMSVYHAAPNHQTFCLVSLQEHQWWWSGQWPQTETLCQRYSRSLYEGIPECTIIMWCWRSTMCWTEIAKAVLWDWKHEGFWDMDTDDSESCSWRRVVGGSNPAANCAI